MQSESINELAVALCKAQSEIGAAKKTGKAQIGKYSYTYADLATVWDACKDALHKNDLSIIQYGVPTEKVAHVGIGTKLIHKSGQWIEGVLEMPMASTTPQAVGSAVTYARRYSLAALLNIPTVDDDGQEATKLPKSEDIAKNINKIRTDFNLTITEMQAATGFATLKDLPLPQLEEAYTNLQDYCLAKHTKSA